LVAEGKFPLRKDGQSALSHFFNVAYYINQAGANFLSVCAGMGHDFVEDKVDQYKREQNVSGAKAVKILDTEETKVLSELEEKVVMFSEQICLPEEIPQKLVSTIALLTRHKRHMYYRSLAEIFNCDDKEIKEMAIQVKLADRMHNIQHLKAYEEEGKIYQCFKNVFILNNVKRYLMEKGVRLNGGNFDGGVIGEFALIMYGPIPCCQGIEDIFLTRNMHLVLNLDLWHHVFVEPGLDAEPDFTLDEFLREAKD